MNLRFQITGPEEFWKCLDASKQWIAVAINASFIVETPITECLSFYS